MLANIVKLHLFAPLMTALMLVTTSVGCSLFPATLQRDSVHNPFPQLKRVAVLPFFNQSGEPTLDTDLVAEKYYAALQTVPGFEVLPVGVAKAQYRQYSVTHGEPRSGAEFQHLAQAMGVEAVVVGSVTDYAAYYPPRMAMTVHWYAANEGFHPIPAGYGLPWGTEHEKEIPRRIAREAEFELARSQLSTQAPIASPAPVDSSLTPVSAEMVRDPFDPTAPMAALEGGTVIEGGMPIGEMQFSDIDAPLPPNWPNPTDLIPDPPSPVRPMAVVNREPILTHTRIYRGDDPYFTNRLADFVETGDDARSSGWQGYLKRSDDFVHFCCHLHITEMLESRGGKEQSDLILRWPLSRY